MEDLHIVNIASATIRQIVSLSTRLEEILGEKYVHLEMGNPGLPPSRVGIEAEREALARGVAGVYPNIAGIPEIKKAGSDFLKAFLDIDIPGRCIVPTVGSMQATFTLFLLMGQRLKGRDTILFLDPGFPAQHNQVKLLGLNQESIDIHDCRGEALEAELDAMLSKGNISAIIYSNPNNPAWTNLTDTEYRALARMAEKHDIIIIEDLAYLGMDFRKRFGVPYQEPFVPTVAKYTDRCIMLVSSSKIFSYAGQRIAMVCMTPAVADRRYPELESFYEMPTFADAYIYGVLYCASWVRHIRHSSLSRQCLRRLWPASSISSPTAASMAAVPLLPKRFSCATVSISFTTRTAAPTAPTSQTVSSLPSATATCAATNCRPTCSVMAYLRYRSPRRAAASRVCAYACLCCLTPSCSTCSTSVLPPLTVQ